MILGRKFVYALEPHTEFFLLPIKYCMFSPLTTYKIPNCMTSFWHISCTTSLRGHRTPMLLLYLELKQSNNYSELAFEDVKRKIMLCSVEIWIWIPGVYKTISDTKCNLEAFVKTVKQKKDSKSVF